MWDQLTPQEPQIAQLAADGLTSRETHRPPPDINVASVIHAAKGVAPGRQACTSWSMPSASGAKERHDADPLPAQQAP